MRMYAAMTRWGCSCSRTALPLMPWQAEYIDAPITRRSQGTTSSMCTFSDVKDQGSSALGKHRQAAGSAVEGPPLRHSHLLQGRGGGRLRQSVGHRSQLFYGLCLASHGRAGCAKAPCRVGQRPGLHTWNHFKQGAALMEACLGPCSPPDEAPHGLHRCCTAWQA